MRVEWTKNATRQKDQVAEYVREQFGYKRKRMFVQDVDKAARMLMRSPNIGQIDPLFASHAATYRSVIINGLNKMVYRVDNDVIYIVALWDTRMEPEERAAQVM
jgi:plasmid stabilization system protein ParE